MKERWFNYRPICLAFLFLLLGSLFPFYVEKQPVVVLVVSIICIIGFALLSIWRKKIKYLLIPLIASIVGMTAYNFAVIRFNDNSINYTPSSIQARVYLVDKPDDNSLKLQADSLIIDGKEYDDNITIYVQDSSGLYEGFEIGSIISFAPSSFYHNDLFYYETPSSSLYSSDLKYTAIVDIENISFKGIDKTFAELIKQKVKENLGNGLTNENIEIAYSSLFGEKELLSDKQYSAMKLSGVAHLMAVSGLHVGIITGIILAVLKLFKAKKWGKFIPVAVILLFYAYICNFAVSVVRAMIMTLILILADIFGREYDSFSSISLAGIICFLMNPLSAFDVSFLLSFSCVFGIAIFNKTFNKALEKWKISNTVTTSLAISLSTMLSLLFIMAYFFQTLNIISLIANVILIPLFTIAYVVIFVLSIVSLIMPFITYLLHPINYLLDLINLIANLLGGLSISNFLTVKINYITIVIYFLLLLLLGRMCTAKSKNKLIITLPIVALLIYLVVI